MTRPLTLPEDLVTARAAGITTVISLLEPHEAAGIGLAGEAAACAALGMDFLSHPIRDMQLPDPPLFAAFATRIAARIRNGGHIALHCYASIGRSGMLACAILGHFGHTPASALTHVTKMRGTPVPDTPEQTDFIHQIMTAWPKR